MGFQEMMRLFRWSLGIWITLAALMAGFFVPSDEAGAIDVGAMPAKYVVAHAEVIVRVKPMLIEPLYYISNNERTNICALKIKATVLEVLKGGLAKGAVVSFLARDAPSISGGLTAFYRRAAEVEIRDPDMDIFPTEYLVFLKSGREGLDADELKQVDSIKSSYRFCLVLRYQWGGLHTVTFDIPQFFDRWAEKKFGGKWISFGYDFPHEWERLKWREIQWGPTDDHVYGVEPWAGVRDYLLRLIQQPR